MRFADNVEAHAYKEIQLLLSSLHLSYIDVKEVDRRALELLPLGSVAADILLPRDPMPL